MNNSWRRQTDDTHLFELLTTLLSPNTNLNVFLQDTKFDWQGLFRIASYHKVDSILYKSLEASGCLPHISHNFTNIKHLTRISDFQNLEKLEALVQVSGLFKQHNIPFLGFKGPFLSQLLYRDPLWRRYSDLDLLIEESKILEAIRLLESLDYATIETKGTFHFRMISADKRIIFEIHFALGPPRFTKIHNYSDFWNHLAITTTYSDTWLRLDSETTLVLLCHHGSRHRWFYLQWALDVAMLVNKLELDWSRVISIANEVSQTRALLMGLYLCQVWFDIQLPVPVHELINQNPKVVTISHRLIRTTGGGSYEAVLSHFRQEIFLRENLVDQIAYASHFVWSRLFTLTHKDKPFQVPLLLAWIYYLVRIVRLAAILTSSIGKNRSQRLSS